MADLFDEGVREGLKNKSTSTRRGPWSWVHGLMCAALAGLFLFPAAALAQETRKVKSNPAPEYPELARKLGIRGTARVLATVAPDGSVKQIKELGGNPVLVAALSSAVKTWKYEPASQTSMIEVKVVFGDQ